jgi:glycine betaine transporter
MLLAGGLQGLQTATIVFALPFALVIVLMVISLWRAMREDWIAQEQNERAMRRRLRELAAK